MSKDRKAAHRKSYRNVHECMEALLGRDDLKKINLLGLWSAFATVDQVKQFAAQPRQERQAFFARYERTLGDADQAKLADPDHLHGQAGQSRKEEQGEGMGSDWAGDAARHFFANLGGRWSDGRCIRPPHAEHDCGQGQ